MRSSLRVLVAAIGLAALAPADAQQIIPTIHDRCWVDPKLLQQALQAALVKVQARRMNLADFRRHISACDRQNLFYYNNVAALP